MKFSRMYLFLPLSLTSLSSISQLISIYSSLNMMGSANVRSLNLLHEIDGIFFVNEEIDPEGEEELFFSEYSFVLFSQEVERKKKI
uniref:Putative secreted protein n=1 Tax=Lutzomyia longipalpis TaxID=7200 RepID=A0A7G3AQC7_LUTLO